MSRLLLCVAVCLLCCHSRRSFRAGEVLVYKDEDGAGDDVRDASSEEVGSPRAEALMEVEEMEPEEVIGPSLGRVLGVLSVIVLVFYALGMGYKLYKIWKGEYVEEEPVFLKYK